MKTIEVKTREMRRTMRAFAGKKNARTLLVICFLCTLSSVNAQNTNALDFDIQADVVSSYVWRGAYQTGAAVQPSISATYGNLSLSAWGSSDFAGNGKEVDFTLGYALGNVSLAFSDYWWNGEGSRYGRYKSTHYFEGAVSYAFESIPLSLSWNTMFADSDEDASGDAYYSTYIALGYDFEVESSTVSLGLGITPWEGMYSDDFALVDVSLGVSKEVKITESYSLPISGQVIVSPCNDNVFFVFGITLK